MSDAQLDESSNIKEDRNKQSDQDRASQHRKDAKNDKKAAPTPARTLDQMLGAIEACAGDTAALMALITEAVQSGLISPGDLQFIEAFVQGNLSGRPLDPSVHKPLAEAVGGPVEDILLSEELPEFMQKAGATGAAFGETVVVARGSVDEKSGKGMDLLTHEVKHVIDHRAAGGLGDIHFDVGQSAGEAGAIEAAGKVKSGHSAELAEIVSHLTGHTSDEDVNKVLTILSHWDQGTITAAWNGGIDPEWRTDLIDNLGGEHFSKFSRELLATFKTLPEAQRYEQILQLTDEGWFNSVNEGEATQVFYLLQGLSQSYLDRFQSAEGGKRYKRFKAKLPGAVAADLQKSLDPEKEAQLKAQENQRQEAADAEQRAMGVGEDLSDDEKAAAAQTLDAEGQIVELLSTSMTDWAVTDAEALKVLQIFGTLGASQVGAIVQKLEADGLVEKWLENLTDSDAYAPQNVKTFIQVLSHRPPQLAIEYATQLLSYGMLDWAVTDEEAILAYHLIRALPASAQETFRSADGAQWFVRMEQNLEEEVLTGEKGDAEGGYGLVDAHESAEDQAAAEAERARDTEIIQEEADVLKGFVTRAEALTEATAIDMLVDLSELDAEQLRAFVRHLDRLALIEKLFDNLGVQCWDPTYRAATLNLLEQRDPMHNISMIRDVLSLGLTDWEVTSEEARLAYEMIRALPEAVRAEFIAEDPSWFGKMDANISLELRESEDFGTYEGDDGDREALIAQLFEDQIWGQTGRLRMVLMMLIQAGERPAALPMVQAHWSETNTELFHELGFPKEGPGIPQHIIDQTDTNTLKMIIQGIDAGLFKSEEVDLPFINDNAVLRGVQMEDLQKALGGHAAGVRFGKGERNEEGADTQDKGEIDLSANLGEGRVLFKAGNLPIESINAIQGGTTVRAGSGQMLGADIDIKWSTDTHPEAYVKVLLEQLVLNDLMIITKNQMFGIAKLDLSGFNLSGERVGPLPEAVDKSSALEVVGELIVGLLRGIASIVESLDDFVGDVMPLNPLFDSANEGPGLAEQIRNSFSEDFNLNLQLTSLTATDIVDSKGGHIASASVGAIDIDIILSQSAKARADIQTIRDGAKNRDLSSKENAQIQALEAHIQDIDNKMAERDVLATRRSQGETLGKDDAARLQVLENELNTVSVSGGITGGLELSGVDIAGVKADQLSASGVTIEGNLAGVDLGKNERDNLSALANIGGDAPDKDAFAEDGTGVKVRAENLSGSNITYSGTTRKDEALDGIIVSLSALEAPSKEELTQLNDARTERAALQPAVAEFLDLKSRIRSLDPAEQSRFQALKEELSQAPSVSVGKVDASGVTLGGDLGSDVYSVGAESMSASDIQAGANSIENVELKGASATINTTEGAESIKTSVTSGSVTGIKSESGDIDKLDLSGFGADIERLSETKIKVNDLHLGQFSVSGVDIKSGANHIEVKDSVTLSGVEVIAEITLKTDDAGKATTEIADAIIKRAHFDKLLGTNLKASTADMKVELAEGSIDGVTLKDFKLSDSTFAGLDVKGAGIKGLTANMGAGISASVGDLQATDVSMTSVTAGEMTFKLDDLSGNKIAANMDGLGIKVDRFDGVSADVSMAGDKIDLKKVSLGTLSLPSIDWKSGTQHITSQSPTVIHGVTFDGSVTMADKDSKDPIKSAHITRFHIDGVEVSNMVMTDGDMSVKLNPQMQKDAGLEITGVNVIDLDWAPGKTMTGSASIDNITSSKIAAQLSADMQAGVSFNASDLSVQFRKNGDMIASIGDLDASLKGKAAGADISAEITDLSTGDITVGKDRIDIPNFTLGAFEMPSIAYTSPEYTVGMLPGGKGVKVSDATLSVSALLDKDGGVRAVEIKSFKIPSVEIGGLTIGAVSQGITISLPADKVGTISDLALNDFNLQAPAGKEGSWLMDGKASIGGINIPKVQADMKESIMGSKSMSTSIDVGRIDIGMLKDGKGQTLDVASIDLTNIDLGTGSDFKVTKGVNVTGIKVATDAEGKNDVSIDSMIAKGLVYDDGNLRMVIDSASMPKGMKIPPSGEFILPESTLKNAQFQVRDLMALSGETEADAKATPPLLQGYDFLNTLDGALDAYVDIDWAPDIKKLHIAVEKGVFDFAAFEDSLPMLYDFGLDFEVHGNELQANLDPFFKIATLASWSLDDQEKALAKQGRANMSTLVGNFQETVEEEPKKKPKKKRRRKKKKDKRNSDMPVKIAIKNIHGDFSLQGPSTIDLGTMGKIKLGSNALDGMLNFTVDGNIKSKEAGPGQSTSGSLKMSMKSLNMGLDGINAGGAHITSPKGAIQIKNLKDTKLNFNGLTPTSMSGILEEATARGLVVKMDS